MTRILVVGAGATGGYFGLRLAQAGRDVTFLVRPQRSKTLRRRGLRLLTPAGAERIQPQLVESDALTGAFDIVILTVKATAIGTAIKDMTAAVGAETMVIPVLNGIGHFRVLDAAFGTRAVLGGVAKVVASLTEDGDIYQFFPRASLIIGPRDRQVSTDAFQQVAQSLDVAGIELATSADIDAELWRKWVFIASLSAATTLLGGTAGDIAGTDGGSATAAAIVGEATAVSAAAGFVVDPAPVVALFTDPGSSLTASLYRDMISGRRTEVEPVLGDMVGTATKLGVAAPLLTAAAVHLRILNQRNDLP